MNTLERIALTVGFQQPDRLPVIPQVFGHAARMLNIPLREYCTKGEILAECQLSALDRYGYDAIFAIPGVCIETETLGAKLEYRDELYPFVKQYPVDSLTNLARLKTPNPARDGRMPEILRSLSIMRREVGENALVVGCVLGPLTLAVQLMGIEQALFAAADDPDAFESLLDFCVSTQTTYGRAQLQSGAHLVLIFDPCSSTEVVPAQFFRELEMPRLNKMFGSFKESGAIAFWLHVAGQAEGIFPYYRQAGVDIGNFDHTIEPVAIRRLLPETCVNGNINSLYFVEESPEAIAIEAERLIKAFSGRGGFILSSGCEIPPEAKPENIKALVDAVLKENKRCITSM